MKKMVKRVLCAALAAAVVMLNCGNVMASDKSVSLSDLMASDEVKSGAEDNVDIEAEEIFGAEKATTTIDSNSKRSSSSDSKKSSSSSKSSSSKTTSTSAKADNTPKTGIEETPLYMPVLLMLAAAAAMIIAGVNIFGKKRHVGRI